MAFKINRSESSSLETPESLFRDLRTRKIPGLLSHQADVLREYVNTALNEQDVALQLPTGSGKTLVGLLIAEWRRRKFNERTIYLCPTNQLVHQVVNQAINKYGIKVHAFTGKKRDYDPIKKSEYLSGEIVAVTSYSALFNTSPFFADPNIIVLDDAHSAENNIASFWSVHITKDEYSTLFSVIGSLLKTYISSFEFRRLMGEGSSEWDNSWIEKIPTPQFYEMIPSLIEILDAHVSETDLKYSWGQVRDHLQACQVYLGFKEILIRPLIPPTETHRPFAQAKQRIYMSATLGEGGDLERLTGRKHITRLHVPNGWDRQGIGRRLFLFPTRSLQENEINELFLEIVKIVGRAMVIVTSDRNAKKIKDVIRQNLKFDTFDAFQIETSKDPFISNPQAVAVVANRYDGIDFPDDECRLMFIQGLSKATNLQESFFVKRMGATILLNDRILTRVVQAFGRCTRGATDYAAIFISSEELQTYLLKIENREFLHPELQAEIEFGIEQSKELEASEFVENLKLFLKQGEEWQLADNHILSIRKDKIQKQLPSISNLQNAVRHEIEYQYALWYEDFFKALECSRKVLTELIDPELRGYRSLWNYLAGSVAWLISKKELGNLTPQVIEYYNNAKSCAPGLRWLYGLIKADKTIQNSVNDGDSQLLSIIETLEDNIEKLGTSHNLNFVKKEKFILDNIKETEFSKFEAAHVEIGTMLGYNAGNQETPGAPDPWWMIDDTLCFIFEDHSDAKMGSSLKVEKARQVATHANWVRERLDLSDNAEIIPIIITSVKKADYDALPHLKNVYLWDIDDFRKWTENALGIIRELRNIFPGSGDLVWRAEAIQKYKANKLDPKGLIGFLKKHPASELLK